MDYVSARGSLDIKEWWSLKGGFSFYRRLSLYEIKLLKEKRTITRNHIPEVEYGNEFYWKKENNYKEPYSWGQNMEYKSKKVVSSIKGSNSLDSRYSGVWGGLDVRNLTSSSRDFVLQLEPMTSRLQWRHQGQPLGRIFYIVYIWCWLPSESEWWNLSWKHFSFKQNSSKPPHADPRSKAYSSWQLCGFPLVSKLTESQSSHLL